MRTLATLLAAATLGLPLLTACSPSASATDKPATSIETQAAVVIDGPKATDFTLTAVDGSQHSLSHYLAQGKTVVLEWFNPDCPFVKKYHSTDRLMLGTYEGAEGDVVWLAINSGAPGKQGAGLERNVKAAQEFAMPYPVLLDESGDVGRAYGAKTTPHMYVITPQGVIAYDGAIDDSGGRSTPNTNYVLAALSDLGAGRAVAAPESKPFGCTVKYAD